MAPSTLTFLLLSLLTLTIYTNIATAKSNSNSSIFSKTISYPLPNQANIRVHDPSILFYNNTYYLFIGGEHIPVHKSSSLSGPWTRIGTVLSGPSVVGKQNSSRPWAPTVVGWGGRVYCFYAVSRPGGRDSAIGVASTHYLDSGNDNGNNGDSNDSNNVNITDSWTDHGALIETAHGNLSDIYPYNISNAIDPSFISDVTTNQPYLVYGSFWSDIWQVPLTGDLLGVENPGRPDAVHLAFANEQKAGRNNPIEGSFMSYRDPYYYLWFSHGRCCGFEVDGFPDMGDEYSIRVGRSKNVRGPFVDKNGRNLTDNGGTIVYGSNHGVVYAPGGLGVLAGNGTSDVLYYHYLNTSIGFSDSDAHLGWNNLDYVDGWPRVRGYHNSASRFLFSPKLLGLMFVWFYIWF